MKSISTFALTAILSILSASNAFGALCSNQNGSITAKVSEPSYTRPLSVFKEPKRYVKVYNLKVNNQTILKSLFGIKTTHGIDIEFDNKDYVVFINYNNLVISGIGNSGFHSLKCDFKK